MLMVLLYHCWLFGSPEATSASVDSTDVTPGLSASTRSTAGWCTSVTTTEAPSSTRWRTRWWPTFPTPATPTVRPDRVGDPQTDSAAARMPWNTPYAVSTDESPAPPCSTVRPVTKVHSSAMTSMSSE